MLTAAGVLLPVASLADDWPPVLDTKNPVTQSSDGRQIERYWHGPRAGWAYPDAPAEWACPSEQETGSRQQNHNSFYLVSPKVPHDNAPLLVVLHSANSTAFDYLGLDCLGRQFQPHDDTATAMTRPPDDAYTLFLNSTNGEWWGWSEAFSNSKKNIHSAPATERRVLDTIEWVVEQRKIDRNRIYLTGVSMGGCGSLGIGMHHGDIFAALRVIVPAGTGYANYSFGGFAPSPAFDASSADRDAWVRRASGEGLPDPPVIVDCSSQVDNWSATQPALVTAAVAGHLPLILGWGPFGHSGFGLAIDKYPACAVVDAFPWMEIRKNEAYPVFTHASCDDVSPWLNTVVTYTGSGQLNAWFRWKSEVDTTSDFRLQLWIAHPATTSPIGPPRGQDTMAVGPLNSQPSQGTLPGPLPQTATADVTLRRLQQFHVQPGHSYAWKLTRNGEAVASGNTQPGGAGLLTIPQIPLTTEPSELTLTAD